MKDNVDSESSCPDFVIADRLECQTELRVTSKKINYADRRDCDRQHRVVACRSLAADPKQRPMKIKSERATREAVPIGRDDAQAFGKGERCKRKIDRTQFQRRYTDHDTERA